MTGRSGRLQGQIVRFLVTGALAFVIDYGILISLTELAGVNYLISAAAGFLAAVLFNYVLSVRWVFRGATVPPPRTFYRSRSVTLCLFVILSTIGLAINNGVMWILVEHFCLWYAAAKIFATAVVMIFNFVTRKLLLEGKSA